MGNLQRTSSVAWATRGADNAGWEALKYHDHDEDDDDDDHGDDDDDNGDEDDDDDDLHDISVPLSARWARATIEDAEEESVLQIVYYLSFIIYSLLLIIYHLLCTTV